MSIWRYLIFLSMMLTLMGGGQYYLWRRLIRDAELPQRWRLALTALLCALLVTIPVTMLSFRQVSREALAPLAYTAFIWLGMLSTLFWVLAGSDLVRLLVTRIRSSTKTNEDVANPDRRAALSRIFAGGVTLGGATLGGVAVGNAIAGFSVVEQEVRLDKLPKEFDGLRIVQLSDVHVGPTIGRDFVEKMVAAANSLAPDLVAITGDLVDGSVAHLRKHTEPLRELQATLGRYFVTGNHEYYSGADAWIEEVGRLGIPTLRNESVRLERNGASFLLAGVTDHRAEQFGDAPDLARALRKRREGEEVVLLAHQPREIDEAKKHDVGLQLSGHTHGGQFWPWNWAVYLVQPVVAGLARFGRTQIYVNSGTGYWGPPMRLGTESEITLITLRSA